MKQKPVLKFPGTSYLIDKPYIDIGSVTAVTILSFFFFMSVALLLSWHDFPLLPLPTNNRVPLYHLFMFYKMWFGKLVPFFQGESYQQYTAWIFWLDGRGELGRLGWRWVFSFLVGTIAAVKIAFAAWKATETEIQIRGRVLVEGEDAYPTFKRDLANQLRREADDGIEPAFIIETDNGYNPNDPDLDQLKPNEKVCMPDGQRRPHFLFAAGSRRGKTQIIKKRTHEFKRRILAGEIIKLFIVDTPKADYSRDLPHEMMHMCAPHDKNGVAWWVANDLNNKLHAETFWKGQIPDNEKDPFWSMSSRAVSVGSTVALINECGTDWGFNNVVHYLKLTAAELEPIIRQHYPEAIQIIQMGETTLSNVLGTMESFTTHLLQLAEAWDGYQYKRDINQMSVRLLQDQYETNQIRLAEHLIGIFQESNGKSTPIIDNIIPHLVFRGIIRSLNKEFGNEEGKRWAWANMVSILKKPYREIFAFAGQTLTQDEKSLMVSSIAKQPIIQAFSRLLQRGFAFNTDEEMIKYVNNQFSKPEDQHANMVFRALIRKHWHDDIPFVDMVDSLEQWDTAIFDIVANNLSSHELASLANKNDHQTLITKLAPIFSWYNTWDKFEAQPRFSFRDWLYDENPDKKIFVLKQSGTYHTITSPLIRGMLLYAKGIIDDDAFLDDKDAGFVRQFYILMDEFQALGNIKDFIEPALERFASKGVTVMLAVQALSQLVKIQGYGQEFVDFLLGNTGNIFFIGSNIGKDTEIISNAVGKKWFKKLHTSITYQENGKSVSQNWQEHEGIVITPDEVNSKLGLDQNGYPQLTLIQRLWNFFAKFLPEHHRKDWITEPKKLPIRYLYLGANMPKAYILETPVCRYKSVTQPEPADWIDRRKDPKPNNFSKQAHDILANGALHDLEKDKKPLNGWVLSELPTSQQQELDQVVDIGAWDSDTPEEAYEVQHELTNEESHQILEDLKLREERAPIYILEQEHEGTASEVAKDMAFEAVVDSHALSAVKHTADALLGSNMPKTTDREKFKQSLEERRRERQRTKETEGF
ncbi:type IV secretion system DNA-binding domain-containing protein [Burkholderia sp. LMG 13014]|uniref:type IV secretion system DNA-binding domain-containing protein n=1 Tax=Burkholderia sp. LMG 13014 TaxID=2709306 RepID=UPI001963B11F|nr:type IV secretion system DNA-binding domain-containing protein [Burkholderia sp. LMG 13014]